MYKWVEVTRNWRKLHTDELHYLYSSPNIIWVVEQRRIMCWVGHAASGRERTGAYRVIVWCHERKRPLIRPQHRWDDIIKMDIKETGLNGMDWTDLYHETDK